MNVKTLLGERIPLMVVNGPHGMPREFSIL